MTKVVISLTSIPPRFAGLAECLNSLLNQTAAIAEVVLYLPRAFRRFPGPWALPNVPAGVTIRQRDLDLGPATKVLPAVADYADTDTLILFCDDDKIYHPTWAQHLIDAAAARPDEVVTCVGAKVAQFSRFGWESRQTPAAQFVRKDWRYRARRTVSLGRWKPPHIQSSGYVDILCGWGGSAVRPSFFEPDDFFIPDVLWTVDDVWLSGCLAKNGVAIWLENIAPDQAARSGVNDQKAGSLRYTTYRGYDRTKANHACVRYFRENHGIWGGAEQLRHPAPARNLTAPLGSPLRRPRAVPGLEDQQGFPAQTRP